MGRWIEILKIMKLSCFPTVMADSIVLLYISKFKANKENDKKRLVFTARTCFEFPI